MRSFDFFMCISSGRQLSNIIDYTSKKLIQCDLSVTTRGWVLKYIGILILMTRCAFSDRRTLWGPSSFSKYLAPQNFGDLMSRQRFQDIRQNIGFSKECDTFGRWGSVCEFMSAINDHRSFFFFFESKHFIYSVRNVHSKETEQHYLNIVM